MLASPRLSRSTVVGSGSPKYSRPLPPRISVQTHFDHKRFSTETIVVSTSSGWSANKGFKGLLGRGQDFTSLEKAAKSNPNDTSLQLAYLTALSKLAPSMAAERFQPPSRSDSVSTSVNQATAQASASPVQLVASSAAEGRLASLKRFLTGPDLPTLERAANAEPQNSAAQVAYLNMLNSVAPSLVMSRVESGKYIVDAAVRSQYDRAMFLLGYAAPRAVPEPATSTIAAAETASGVVATATAASSSGSGVPPVVLSGPIQVRLVTSTRDAVFGLLGKLLWLAALAGVFVFTIKSVSKDNAAVKEANGVPGLTAVFPQDQKDGVITLDTVKGIDEVKDELRELVDFLKNPQKYTRMGARLPKGVLLIGDPGTGKTLTARAIAGEAGVPFFSTNGSSFDEMFIGVGSKRVRSLFQFARKHAPCIIFIDEIDGVGRKRSNNMMSHDEEGKTLNALLTEMDGFDQSAGIIVIGATNRDAVLDPALVRPGRFNKKIQVPLPDVKGRKEILDMYLGRVLKGRDVDSSILARATPRFTGADIENLVNLAATKAAVKNSKDVSMQFLEEALDDIRMGLKHRRLPSREELMCTAYHEAGHALASLFSEGSLPLHKVTIASRGNALGVTFSLPEETNYTHQQLVARLVMAMGGRAAEELIYGKRKVTTGASSDLQTATDLAKAMVTKWGMNDTVGLATVQSDEGRSELLQQTIDKEVKDVLQQAYDQALYILQTHQPELHRLADALLKHETISASEVHDVIRGKMIEKIL